MVTASGVRRPSSTGCGEGARLRGPPIPFPSVLLLGYPRTDAPKNLNDQEVDGKHEEPNPIIQPNHHFLPSEFDFTWGRWREGAKGRVPSTPSRRWLCNKG